MAYLFTSEVLVNTALLRLGNLFADSCKFTQGRLRSHPYYYLKYLYTVLLFDKKENSQIGL